MPNRPHRENHHPKTVHTDTKPHSKSAIATLSGTRKQPRKTPPVRKPATTHSSRSRSVGIPDLVNPSREQLANNRHGGQRQESPNAPFRHNSLLQDSQPCGEHARHLRRSLNGGVSSTSTPMLQLVPWLLQRNTYVNSSGDQHRPTALRRSRTTGTGHEVQHRFGHLWLGIKETWGCVPGHG